jgi:glucosyl-dolichyl phosphate glucuronosyltransferase
MQTSITVAICTRNRAALLEKAVRSVLSQTEDKSIEILIVDNGSTDHTAACAAGLSASDPRVKFFSEPRLGLSVARNRALHQAAGEWVVFIDDDAEVERGWLAAYENFFRLPNERVAAVGGAVVPRYEIPAPKWVSAEETWGPNEGKPFCFAYGHSPSECNCAYRREAALHLGGFDPQLGHHGEVAGYREGADLSVRLQDAGYEIWWLPGAAVRHLIHADRLNLKWLLHAAFNEGRSIAIQRLKSRAGSARAFYIAGRALVAPFYCGVKLLLALVSFPFLNGRVAAKALQRAASIAGFAGELLRQFLHYGAGRSALNAEAGREAACKRPGPL